MNRYVQWIQWSKMRSYSVIIRSSDQTANKWQQGRGYSEAFQNEDGLFVFRWLTGLQRVGKHHLKGKVTHHKIIQ